MHNKFTEILNTYVKEAAKVVPFNIPQLNKTKMQIPQLNKI